MAGMREACGAGDSEGAICFSASTEGALSMASSGEGSFLPKKPIVGGWDQSVVPSAGEGGRKRKREGVSGVGSQQPDREGGRPQV